MIQGVDVTVEETTQQAWLASTLFVGGLGDEHHEHHEHHGHVHQDFLKSIENNGLACIEGTITGAGTRSTTSVFLESMRQHNGGANAVLRRLANHHRLSKTGRVSNFLLVVLMFV